MTLTFFCSYIDMASAEISNMAASREVFSFDKLPISQVPLGAFPYIGLPQGYVWNRKEKLDCDHFLFWTGVGIQDGAGRNFCSTA